MRILTTRPLLHLLRHSVILLIVCRPIELVAQEPLSPLAFVGHSAAVCDVSFSADSQLLASAGDDHTVRVWRLSDCRELQVWPHDDPIERVHFLGNDRVLSLTRTNPNQQENLVKQRHGSRLRSMGSTAEAFLWQIHQTEPLADVRDLRGRFIDAHSSADGRFVALLLVAEGPKGARELRILDRDGQVHQRYTWIRTATILDIGPTRCFVRFLPTGNRVAFIGNPDGTENANMITVLDAETGEIVSRCEAQLHIKLIAVSPDGRFVAAAVHAKGKGKGFAGYLQVWNVESGELLVQTLPASTSSRMNEVSLISSTSGSSLKPVCSNCKESSRDLTFGR